MRSLRHQALSAAGWALIQTWGSRIATLVLTAVLAHLLAVRDFGLVAFATVAVTLVQTFQDQGFSQAIVQREDIDPEHLDAAFWISIALGVVGAGALIGAAGPVSNALNQPGLASVLRWLSLTCIVFGFDSVQTALLRRELRFRPLAIRQLVATLAGGIVGVALAVAGAGVQALVWQAVTAAVVSAGLLWTTSTWRPRFRFSVRHARELSSFGIYAAGLSLTSLVSQRLDDVLVGTVLGAQALGYYSIAYRVLLILADLFVNVINSVALPVFSRLQSQQERARRALSLTLTALSALSLPTFILTCVFAPLVIDVVFGHRWQPAAPVLRVLAIIGIFQGVNFILQWFILAMGAKRPSLALNALNAVANAVGFAVSVHWGITAVAIAFTARAYLLFPITVLVLQRLSSVGWRDILVAIRPSIAAAAVLAAVATTWNILQPAWPDLGILVVGCLLGLVAYAAVFRITSPDQWRTAVSLVRQYGRSAVRPAT